MVGLPHTVLEGDVLFAERRARLSAERMLDHVRDELLSAHRALSVHIDQLNRRYVDEREARVLLTGRTTRVAEERRIAQARAERTDRRLLHAVEAIRDGFAIWDSDGRLVQANAPYIAMFDGIAEPEPGTPYAAMLRAAAEEGVIDLAAGRDDGVVGPAEVDAWIDRMLDHRRIGAADPVLIDLFDGRRIRLQDRMTEDGDVVSLAVDVTAEAEREATAERARHAAEAANEAKSRFLARMSHEFRTPMNGVIGMSDLMLERDLDADDRRDVETIRDAGLSLLDIVNDVLDAATLDAGRMTLNPAPFDLERTLAQVVRLASASGGAASSVALDYPLDAPIRFRGDEARIRQIVTNLVGNAVKFARGGDVTVRVRVTRPESGDAARLAVEVIDTGPGIPADRRAHVFGEFARLDGESGEGAGLGLSIARDMARLMDGDLVLTDDGGQGGGATFELTLTLPVEAADPPPRPPRAVRLPDAASHATRTLRSRLRASGIDVDGPPSAPLIVPGDLDAAAQERALAEAGQGRLVLVGGRSRVVARLAERADAILPDPCDGAALLSALAGRSSPGGARAPSAHGGADGTLRILAADDVATNRILLDRMLARDGRAVTLAEDGDDAVDLFAAEAFDLVILDISMPRMDGREAARLIRDMPGGRAARLVALTAHADPEEVGDIRRAGFDEVMLKPVRRPDLDRIVGEVGAPSR